MTPFNPRLVFAAVVAFTDRITKDGRILATPEGFVCPARALPAPVLWTPPNQSGQPVPTEQVGTIGEAFVIDHRLIVFGHLDESDRGREVFRMLDEGSRFLEIDIDSGDMLYDLDPLGDNLYLTKPVGPVIFKSWKLTGAWVGSEPCWDLPRVQVEEITR